MQLCWAGCVSVQPLPFQVEPTGQIGDAGCDFGMAQVEPSHEYPALHIGAAAVVSGLTQDAPFHEYPFTMLLAEQLPVALWLSALAH